MNAELPPFENGEHNSKNASTINRVITPLTLDAVVHVLSIPIIIAAYYAHDVWTYNLSLSQCLYINSSCSVYVNPCCSIYCIQNNKRSAEKGGNKRRQEITEAVEKRKRGGCQT